MINLINSKTKYMVLMFILIITMFLCFCIGTINISPISVVDAIFSAISGKGNDTLGNILINIRIPRVLAAALVGAALSISGTAMQGLLRNPLADGSTLGVSSAASLGAVIAILTGLYLPVIGSTTLFAITFSFIYLIFILFMAYAIDKTLATNTIILTGIIFSMFISAIIMLLIAFSGNHLRSITFWTMGSLSSTNYNDVWLMLIVLIVFASVLLSLGKEINAFAIGENNARFIGVNVKKTKLTILIAVAVLIGTAVSISGTIGFVGLIIPHITRLSFGFDNKKLLPISMIIGAIFLMLCDLIARTILSPVELPIGVISSMIGTLFFISIFYKKRRSR
ncbi:MAG: iron ABC transporter permease [Christensenellaceae bacterium]|nr:iron ABC transporter permease [Christensenellaceae bacterium]